MDQEIDQINDLDTLKLLLDDIERAMAEEGSLDEQQREKLEQLRKEYIIRKKELLGDQG